MNQEMEFYAPIKVGDRISSQMSIANVFEKSIRLDPKAVWIVMETRMTNQNDELVALVRTTLLTHRTPEEVEGDRDE
jgi:acyl dehydratase